MLHLTNTTTIGLLEWSLLIDILEDAFRNGASNPKRHQYEIPVDGAQREHSC